MVKALIIVVLAVAVFGSGAYWTYQLFVRPNQELAKEKAMPPPPPPPDPALPEFEKCVALQKELKLMEARAAFERFIEENPQSTKVDEAKDRLGEINTSFLLSPAPTPEKELYIVKSGDVLTRVAARTGTTPELIMRSNNLTGTMLRIGQRLMISRGQFSVVISKGAKKVTLLKEGRFFKQYPIRSFPRSHAAAPAKKGAAAPKVAGKVTEKVAWSGEGHRVTFADKEYEGATHWIVTSITSGTLYSDVEVSNERGVVKPPDGFGLANEHMAELAVLLRKGDPVTIEP